MNTSRLIRTTFMAVLIGAFASTAGAAQRTRDDQPASVEPSAPRTGGAPVKIAPSVPTPPLPVAASPGGPATQAVQKRCNNTSTCHQLISDCAVADGQWVPTGFNGRGETTGGYCFID
ncbi:MAG: hypothetical protein KIT73_01725 [Burkholderiales bacterium]|nr:hypothetical protein [Burkholderiales bacterium]